MGENYQARARTQRWQGGIATVGPRLEGDTSKQLFLRKQKAVANLAMSWARGILALQPWQKTTVAMAVQIFAEDWESRPSTLTTSPG